jgi:hypothetical protein
MKDHRFEFEIFLQFSSIVSPLSSPLMPVPLTKSTFPFSVSASSLSLFASPVSVSRVYQHWHDHRDNVDMHCHSSTLSHCEKFRWRQCIQSQDQYKTFHLSVDVKGTKLECGSQYWSSEMHRNYREGGLMDVLPWSIGICWRGCHGTKAEWALKRRS